jgi:hypothetical protein
VAQCYYRGDAYDLVAELSQIVRAGTGIQTIIENNSQKLELSGLSPLDRSHLHALNDIANQSHFKGPCHFLSFVTYPPFPAASGCGFPARRNLPFFASLRAGMAIRSSRLTR